MLAKEITDSILTIGCEYRSPKGGVAQVIDSYFKLVFATFLFSANSTSLIISSLLKNMLLSFNNEPAC